MQHVFVFGAGQIGTLIGWMLNECSDYEVCLVDTDPNAENRIRQLFGNRSIPVLQMDAENSEQLAQLIQRYNTSAVVSALPYYHNVVVARVARECNVHYFDLTEDTSVTTAIKEIAKGSRNAFVPQCGLAPGFINIVAKAIIEKFQSPQNVKLRVGALPQYPSNQLKYALTWSTDGLINEYGNLCPCISDGKLMEVQPLEGLEEIEIDGTLYEAFNTSGGLGSMVDTYKGRIKYLDYKTIRYPGHCMKMRLLMNELNLNSDRPTLKRLLENALPKTIQDVVVVFVSVCGLQNGSLREENYVNRFYPQEIAGRLWSAIQITTSAGVCGVVDHVLMSTKPYSGFVAQEDFQLRDILKGRFGKFFNCQGDYSVSPPMAKLN